MADITMLLQVLESGAGDERQYFYLGRITSWDFAARTGPEFSEPGRGTYQLEQIPLTLAGLGAIDLKPAAVAGLLRDAIASGVTCTRCRICDPPRASGAVPDERAGHLAHRFGRADLPVHVGRDFPVMVRAERARQLRLHGLRRGQGGVQPRAAATASRTVRRPRTGGG